MMPFGAIRQHIRDALLFPVQAEGEKLQGA